MLRLLNKFKVSEGQLPSTILPAYHPEALRRDFGGVSLDQGLYRFHTEDSADVARGLIRSAFPDFASRNLDPFGYDWIGKQYVLDPTKGARDDHHVMMLDMGVGKGFVVPFGISAFHDVALTEHAEDTLSLSLYQEWRLTDNSALARSECVGLKIPLFLSGEWSLDNLEREDLDLYWTLTGQLRVKTLALPGGTRIGPVAID